MSPVRTLWRITLGFALGAFVLGAALAQHELSGRLFVREFQAGAASPWAEKAFAVVQRAAIEGLGFGLVGLLAGATALLVNRRSSAEPAGRRIAAELVVVLAAFTAWLELGTRFVNEAVSFLPPLELLGLNLAGMAAALLALLLFRALVRRVPGAPLDAALALATGSLAAAGAAAYFALALLRGGGWREPGSQALAALCFVAALPLAALLARLLRTPLERLASFLARRARVPQVVVLGVLVLFLAALAYTRPFLSLSPVADDASPAYARLEARGTPPGPNVVFVTIDTLRADHLGCYGYPRPTSPFIDSLAAAGARFDDPVSAAAWTKPATGTLLTGLYPSRHGALYHGSSLQVPEGGKTLAEALRDAGWATAGFVSNPNVKKVFDFDRGFDEYFDAPVEDTVGMASARESWFGTLIRKLTNYQFNWKYENDVNAMNAQVLAWLETNHDLPFFLYVHYIDPHEPYAPPPDYAQQFAQDHGTPLFNKRKRLVGIDLYDAEIRYTDDGIGELVAALQRLGVWEKTLLVLTSDHGEEFLEHEVLGHGFSLYQPVVRVPLILHGPGVAQGSVVTAPVQLVDLAATLLDVLGTGITSFNDGRSFAAAMTDPAWRFDGELLVENEFGEDDHDIRSFVLNSVREGPWKLVATERNKYRPPGARYPAVELYNLDTDPEERTNLYDDPRYRDVGRRLFERLKAHGGFLQETGFRHIEPAALSPEVEAELRAIGYL